MKYELKHLGIWSVAKISFLLGGALGLFVGTMVWMFASLFSQIANMSGSDIDVGAMSGLGPLGAIFAAGMYGVMMMIMNVIMAAIYNLFASLVGGLELNLELEPVVTYTQQPAPVTYEAPPSAPNPTHQAPSQPSPQPPPPSPPPSAAPPPAPRPNPPAPPPGTDG